MIVHRAGGPAAARRKGLEILASVARYPMPWSQELVTLRCVQSLTCLDVINTRRVIATLGEYETEPGPVEAREPETHPLRG